MIYFTDALFKDLDVNHYTTLYCFYIKNNIMLLKNLIIPIVLDV